MSLHVPDGTRHHAPDGARHRQGPDGITPHMGRGIVRRLRAQMSLRGHVISEAEGSPRVLKTQLEGPTTPKGWYPRYTRSDVHFWREHPASIRFPGHARLIRPRGILRVQRLWLVINVTTIPTRIGISQIAADLGAPVLR